MSLKIHVEKFGKIKKADIELTPFTLFVGDNNSGKSYLLSLIWALQSSEIMNFLYRDITVLVNSPIYKKLFEIISNSYIENKELYEKLDTDVFLELLNILLEKNKKEFVARIFNHEGIDIEKLAVWTENKKVIIKSTSSVNRLISIYVNGQRSKSIGIAEVTDNKKIDTIVKMIINSICSNILDVKRTNLNEVLYLPSARTGFMLSRTLINQYGRQNAFDKNFSDNDFLNEEIQPFTKPILSFLNALDNEQIKSKDKFIDLISFIEIVMTKGCIRKKTAGEKVDYIPSGISTPLPLRATSAVVTELSPLLILLLTSDFIKLICYEEPEMCLHPQLQQEMGKVLIRLVNLNVNVVATTHSDIIIQHINNMCILNSVKENSTIKEKFDLKDEDLISENKVAVYQLTDCGTFAEVDRIYPKNASFNVPTFTDSLIKILEQTTEINSLDGE
ncbi:AAA family ATPase [Phascolarctobacterium faecium]|uniref:AAA family ATPase n=1 Tax=Phascolarctobacterium faecium TaxID=33025 RepID=UPI003A84BD8D